MYYKFSGFTRALTGASAPGAYGPQGLRPGCVADSPAIVFGMPIKHAPESGTAPEFLGKNRVSDLQKLFQKSDGFPVHLKRGLPDQLLYRTTMALTVGGALYCLVAIYMAAQPRNKKLVIMDRSGHS